VARKGDEMLTLEERRERAKRIVRSVEFGLASPNGQLREAVLSFRKAFLDDVQATVLGEVWVVVFDTSGWRWLEENWIPVYVRNEPEAAFLARLDVRLKTWKTN